MLTIAAAFEPAHFVENLRYMGLGMLGIFIVIGAIVLLTVLLNALTAKKDAAEQKDEQQVEK